jgi:large subunit ribosomal protein L28
MNICYYCEKSVLYGRSHTHHRGVAGGRWKKRAPKTRRIFKPNLQPVRILVKGEIERVKLCSKCLKRIKKDMAEGKKPFLILYQSTPKITDTIKEKKE